MLERDWRWSVNTRCKLKTKLASRLDTKNNHESRKLSRGETRLRGSFHAVKSKTSHSPCKTGEDACECVLLTLAHCRPWQRCNQRRGCVWCVHNHQAVYHSWGMRWTAGTYSNINRASDPSEDDEFYKDEISLWSGKRLRCKDRVASSRYMGLIRSLEMRLKRDPAPDWIVFAIIAENSLFSADRKKGNHKTQGRRRRRSRVKDGCHLKPEGAFFVFLRDSTSGQVLYQLEGLCRVCLCARG